MSIFGNIMSAIFGSKPAGASPASSSASPSSPGGATAVDVEAVMNDLASKSKEKLNWRTSIVDLMKLLKLDSSLTARKELAKELGYKESTDDTAPMNIWLHKQVMTKLAANGGKVPSDLH